MELICFLLYNLIQMEPKFQSSFIPKDSKSFAVSSTIGRKIGDGNSLFGLAATALFIVSIVFVVGMFGYKFYLRYRIAQMGSNLESARAALEPESIRELTRLNDRIVSAQTLIAQHEIITPLFKFLQISTPKNVRFSDFNYLMTEQGLELTMKGEARGYAALALQSDIFTKSGYFKDSIFSNLNLNEKGDVRFSFKAIIDPELLAYSKEVESLNIAPSAPSNFASTSSSTSTPQ